MAAGQNRLPDEIKAFKGTLKKARVDPDRMDVAPARIPAPPKHLLPDERSIWNELRRVLSPLGVVGETDMIAFRKLVHAVVCSDRLDAQEGADPKHVSAASNDALKWLTRFGLTPASRGTVRMVCGPEAAETLDDFLGVN